MKYYKAFNKDMTCRGKQYQENTVYEEAGSKICSKGMMHFCKTPFDTLDYYPLIDENGNFSEFAEVEPLDEIKEKDNKCCSKKIRIGAKLSFKQFIQAGIDILIEKTKPAKVDDSETRAKIGSSEDLAKIGSPGYCTQIGSSGNYTQIGSCGEGAQIGSSGRCTKIGSSGDYARIGSSGNDTQIGSSGHDVQIGSSGDYAQIGSSGDRAKIGSSGDRTNIKLTGERSVASAIGCDCKISGKKGDWIVLAEWRTIDETTYPVCVKAGQIDGDILKEDTFYILKNGKFIEYNEYVYWRLF